MKMSARGQNCSRVYDDPVTVNIGYQSQRVYERSSKTDRHLKFGNVVPNCVITLEPLRRVSRDTENGKTLFDNIKNDDQNINKLSFRQGKIVSTEVSSSEISKLKI